MTAERVIAFVRRAPADRRHELLVKILRKELVAEAISALCAARRDDPADAHRAAFLWLCVETLGPYVRAGLLTEQAAARLARRAVHDGDVELVAHRRQEAAR